MSKAKLIYIAGKISGMEKEAYELFEAAQIELESKGYVVINPMKLPHNHDKTWESYMRECIKELVCCDEIYMLKNWGSSRGAKREYIIAYELGIKRIFQNG
jgi:hypothetical protein